MLKRIKAILNVIIIMALLFGSSISFEGKPASAGDGEEQDLPPLELPEKGNPKLDSPLNQLVSAPRLAASFAQEGTIEMAGNEVRVIVECLPDQMDAVIRAAGDLGIIESNYDNLLQVTVPVSQLTALADTPSVRLVRMPQQPLPAAVSEGVALINADDWQAASYNGTGVKVGILDLGFTGYAALLGTELPASVIAQSFYAGSDIEGDTDHGTACAEIVYDIAPGANFYLTNFGTEVEMGNAVDWLIAQGVNVISCSIGWPGYGPGNGSGTICGMVKKARDDGILWSQAIGNSARKHWQGNFVDADKDKIHDFNKSPFDETTDIYVDSGDPIVVTLNWDDTWGHSGNNYDLYLLNNSLNIVDWSENEQNGNDDPYESLDYIATYTGLYHIVIHKYSATKAVNFNLYSSYHNLQYQVASSSFLVPADSPNAMTVGAVFWNNPTTLEFFSSQGPTKDGRKKPDLVAPDGVSTTTDGASNGVELQSGGTGFFGTSASAPHGAGAAVLVKDLYSSFTPAQIQAFFESRAVDLGTAGKDNLYGSGRLDLGPLPPDAPSGLTATAVSSSQINLSWADNSDDETGFKIERKTGSSAFAQIALVGADVTSYSNTKLKASMTYYYRVRAYNAGGNSDYSNEADNTTLSLPPPAPKLKSPKNKSTVYRLTPSLVWNASTGAADYGLQVATDAGFTSLVVDETGIADTFYDINSGLSWNTTYYWRVNARKSDDSTSRWSAKWYFKTAAGPPPDAPTGLSANATSSTEINLSWSDNSTDETSFRIERLKGTKYVRVGIVGADVTGYSDTKLKASTTYYYRVSAYNAVNNSDFSNEASATTLSPPPPVPKLKSPPNKSTVSSLTPRLVWNMSKGASDYGLQVATDAGFTSLVIDETGITDTFHDITSGLDWNTTYYWRVNARKSDDSTSKWSAKWYFKTPP